ncbi:hypothetical protein OH76DRAFT_1002984 [Lentinus brumalis]|uniref:Uncharacterized protein n=1 Tax=Lentinus brumalis TaxID=2498619 RepID=A0A371DQQ5_9APHY|nr:hypothetical protein OH76DRAFT_895959 [Polyporus brumalis]RDX54834.1 hypothetical protein OH76DRAFT_1002984 [Polyporus brumalis]
MSLSALRDQHQHSAPGLGSRIFTFEVRCADSGSRLHTGQRLSPQSAGDPRDASAYGQRTCMGLDSETMSGTLTACRRNKYVPVVPDAELHWRHLAGESIPYVASGIAVRVSRRCMGWEEGTHSSSRHVQRRSPTSAPTTKLLTSLRAGRPTEETGGRLSLRTFCSRYNEQPRSLSRRASKVHTCTSASTAAPLLPRRRHARRPEVALVPAAVNRAASVAARSRWWRFGGVSLRECGGQHDA